MRSLPSTLAWMIVATVLACGAETGSADPAEVSEASEGSGGEEGLPLVPPEEVLTAALAVRSTLLFRPDPTEVERAASELAWVERAWFATERRACLAELERAPEGASERCLLAIDTLRSALLVEPEVSDDPLPDGTPGVVARLFDHGQLSALQAGVPLDLLRDRLQVTLAEGAEADPVEVEALLDAAANGVIALQQQRLEDLARGLAFLDDAEASGVVLGPAVSGWTWLPPAAVESAFDEGS